jgi:nucleotide-binding universal stress UspA family protein
LFNKILVPLDGSEHANHALNMALDLAEKYSAMLLLVSAFHCIYLQFNPDSDFISFEAMQQCQKGRKSSHEKILSEALKTANKVKPNVTVSTKLLKGRPADQIVETAKKDNVNLIVMGSRGLGGLTQLFLGSVSDQVADKAPCPVLIAK